MDLHSRVSETDNPISKRPVDRTLELLHEALRIIDEEELPAEIGARLDHVICSLEELTEQPGP